MTSLPLSLLNTSIAVDSISDGWFQRGGKDSISSIKRPRPRFRAMLHPGPDHTELNHELWQVCPLEAKRAHMTLGLIKKKKDIRPQKMLREKLQLGMHTANPH